MPSKKTKTDKRTTLPRSSDYTKQFLADWQSLCKSGRYDMNQLKQVMLLLIANEAPLEVQFKDHALKGNWLGYRECHIGGDFLLIYKVADTAKVSSIIFVRAGTHSQLF